MRFVEVPVVGMSRTNPEVIAVHRVVRWRGVGADDAGRRAETVVFLDGGAPEGNRLRVLMAPEEFEALIARANEGRAVLRPTDPTTPTPRPGEPILDLGE